MAWIGRKKIAFIPLHRPNAHPPDDSVPADWPGEILRRVYYDPNAFSGLPDRSLRTYIHRVSSGLADLDATVLPMQVLDQQDVPPNALENQSVEITVDGAVLSGPLGPALRSHGFDAAALVMLGQPPTGQGELGGFWARFDMSETLGTWAMELMHVLTSMDDLYPFGGNMGEYDNMAGQAGTHPSGWTKRAIEWLDPAAVVPHSRRTMEYDLHAVSLVQPPPHDRVSAVQVGSTVPYLMVEARKMADQFDGIIPKEGVIVYRVQTTDPRGHTQNQLAPLALLTLNATGNRSALGVGESLTTNNGVAVQVTSALPGGFRVLIDDPSQPPLVGQLLSYGDAGTPGNVSTPVVVGFGGWQDFKFVFGGSELSGADRIYAVDQNGELLSYGDGGTLGNVSSPVVVGFGGWQDFKFLFGGRNAGAEDRIYAVDQDGQLLSYGDAGTPGNVSSPVVVGFGGWQDFKFLFGGRNAGAEDRIYAVDQDGQLLSYGDAGTPGNVSDPVVVGFGGWQDFKFVFSGRNAAGEDRIYAVGQDGQLLSYADAGTPGNVSSPVVVGFGGWQGFKFLFGGRNAAGADRIYAVVA
jgi:hypothetical protein